ncbi:HYC_CC_PP family protein [Larkinella soli]|uniref:HYC_CC_PP family protein n=1 Tax=Larkinella soli TaxID=1770527 RepID=UPI000FFC4B4F|nr:hypothetical protein [Larkinella soli]
MKPVLFRLFNLLMAFIVLMSSTGFGLVEHSCRIRGKQVSLAVSYESRKTCRMHEYRKTAAQAGSDSGLVIKKTDCCTEDSRYENVDVTSSISHLVAKFIKSISDSALAGVTAMISWLADLVFSTDAQLALPDSKAPPLPFGRTLLSFVQSFLL